MLIGLLMQRSDKFLLIVPEGIEIWNAKNICRVLVALLIVPEGIEIRKRPHLFDCKQSFNRTRRN